MDSPSCDRSTSVADVNDPMLEAARLADVLATNWRRGLCCRAEDVFAEHPALRGHPQAAVRLIYEEVLQRQERGQEVSLTELCSRFPQWADELGVVLDCHQVLGLANRGPIYPEVGEALGEFRLLAELGRGGMGRVYLAKQEFLAGRLTVIKLTPGLNQEHLKLARLQHTHIVSLYSVRDFPDRNLRALCLPCLGGATLGQLLRHLRSMPAAERTGRDLLEALRLAPADPRMVWEVQGPNQRFLEQASYVQAVCWIAVCLADALHYAHEQGLVHLDVKPSNVLLTADAQPMLLDFHLARGPIRLHGEGPDWLGGTHAYMSPEQRDACQACLNQRPVEVGVDGRSDVYSLGVLLREALYGEPSATDLLPRPHLSRGLRDVLARCLHPDPEARYASAALLAEDVRRHLTHRPLAGVPNRSLAERWRKWYRRRPQALILGHLVAACLTTATAFGVLYARQDSRDRREAEEALVQGRGQVEQRHYDEAVQTFDRGLERLGRGAAGDPLHTELVRCRREAARVYDVAALHRQVEQTRYLYGDDLLSPPTLRAVEAQCRTAWEARDRLLAGEALQAETEEQLRRDLLDAAILWVHCRARLAAAPEAEGVRRQALHVLDEAEGLFGPSPVLNRERRALGRAPRSVPAPYPRTAWEHYTLGRSLLLEGDIAGAAEAFDRAVELQPHDFWPWYGKGVCAHRQKRPSEAVTAFTVCVVLSPDSAACYHNRGLARAAAGDTAGALRDCDRALQLDPHLAAAALHRGVLRLQEQQFPEADADFRLALTLGASGAAVCFQQALLHQAQHDPPAALGCLERALELDPQYGPARALRDRLRKQLPATGPRSR
jgi:serine/threonine protein kinase/tetratricopeptide (TPR) repeat protein